MGLFDSRSKDGLPPPPAPTRRDANPWPLSDTARKREQPDRPPDYRGVLDEMLAEAERREQPPLEAAEAPEEASPAPLATGSRSSVGGLIGLLVFLFIGGMALLQLWESTRGGDDWVAAIGPLLVLLFIAHGWWRMRQRRKRRDGGDGPVA